MSPLQAQIVGAVVEREHKSDRGFTLQRFDDEGGVRGAVELYFDTVLSGSQDARRCLKILAALSIRPRFQEQMRREALHRVLFEDKGAVDQEVKYLKQQGLIVMRGRNTVDVAHDYIAEFFHRKSANRLPAAERDNIAVHAQAGSEMNDVFTDRKRWPHFGKAVTMLLVCFMVVRLFYFGLHWDIVGPGFYHPVFGQVFDVDYLRVIVAQGGWLIYVGLVYDRLFVSLKETGLPRALSVFTVFNLIVCVGAGVFSSAAWVLGVCWGGFPVACKLLALSMREDLNPTTKKHLRMFGTVPLYVVLLFGSLGAADWYLASQIVAAKNGPTTWLVVNAVGGALVFAACLGLGPVQGSRSGVSQIKGLLARPRTVTITTSGP